MSNLECLVYNARILAPASLGESAGTMHWRTTLRLLTHGDVPALRRVLEQDPYCTLFMCGDLEVIGVDHPNLIYWEQYAGARLVGVAMRYKGYWQFHDAGGAEIQAFARLVDAYPGDSMISGRTSLVRGVLARTAECQVTRESDCTFCALPRETLLPAPSHATRRATVLDVEALLRHFEDADTGRRDRASIHEALVQTRIHVTTATGRIVSTALTNVEVASMAMIGGVYTPPPLRHRGYATAAVVALCQSLLDGGLQPCLFWDNPAAGRIYRRLGFEDIGGWSMVSLQHR